MVRSSTCLSSVEITIVQHHHQLFKVYVSDMCTHGGKKRMLDPLKLELQIVVYHQRPNLGPLQVQQGLLTNEPRLQH